MENKTQQIKALIELNDELENYFRNTIIPQLFVDADLKLRKFTPPAMKQFKLADSDIGRPLADVKENFRFPTIIENIQHVIDTGEILEKEIQTTDMRWYQMNVLPYIVHKESRTNGVIMTFVDITLRIRDLKEQERLISDHELLLDTISHDIKTPLTGLILTIEMLKKITDFGMERFPILLSKVEGSLKKIQHIIGELTASRWEKHKYQAIEELINIEHILEDVRLTLAPQIEESAAVIKTEIGISEIVFVRRNLRSIIYNLVNNAIKYRDTNRSPIILIRAEHLEEFMVISVQDNGKGISEKDLGAIFRKYQRVSDEGEGTGIGLYLVSEIVKNSGGNIKVESEVGKGSTFSVCLPIQGKQ